MIRRGILELFVNLLDNAIKYTSPHGTIGISLEKEDAFFVMRIRDTGIGIAEDDLKHVFERFYRVDKSRSKDIEGVGLGLSICQEIAELHGGRIGIESQVGRGTAVSVYFPMTG